MNPNKILPKIQGCLAGIIIGDALGMPWEGFSKKEILQLTGDCGIKDFSSPKIRRVKDTAHLPISSTTDDWGLTEAVLKSLIRSNDFNLLDLSLAQIEAIPQCCGSGKATVNSLSEIDIYLKTLGNEGRSPYTISPKQENCGSGNGIAMKVAPLSLFLASNLLKGKIYEFAIPEGNIGYDIINLRKWVWKLGHLTHGHDEASVGAFIIASIIFDLLMLEIDFSPNFSKFLFNRVLTKTVKFEEQFKISTNFRDKLIDLSLALANKSNVDTLIETFGTGVLAIESVMIVLAIFFKNFGKASFKSIMLEMANCGGDVDSNCSILGGLLGTAMGFEEIPFEWKEQTDSQIQKALKYSQKLVE